MLEPTDERRGDELRITVKLGEFQPRQQPGQEALYLHPGRRGTQTEAHAVAESQVSWGRRRCRTGTASTPSATSPHISVIAPAS
jgi:hypothetical protein